MVLFKNKLKLFYLKTEHRNHDKTIFKILDEVMSERDLLDFLDELQTSDSFDSGSISNIDRFCNLSREEGNKYLVPRLKKKSKELISSLNLLRGFLGKNFFVYPSPSKSPGLCYCLHPDLNVDRAGSGTTKESSRYLKFQNDLDNNVAIVRNKYKQYRSAIKTIINV